MLLASGRLVDGVGGLVVGGVVTGVNQTSSGASSSEKSLFVATLNLVNDVGGGLTLVVSVSLVGSVSVGVSNR